MNTEIPWWAPYIGKEEVKLIKQVIKRNHLNDGEFTTEFENKIASLLGCKYAVAVTSGTAALFLSLKALGIGFSDEVIFPDITFIATVNAVEMSGAKPVLIDIDPKTMNMSIEAFTRAVTKKTKAVIPVHVSGRAADMDAIIAIAKKKNISVIEDAAEAFMSKYKGRYLGTLGKTGCFSFSPHKTITTGQGGMAVTNDNKLHMRLRELKDQGRPIRGTGGDDLHNCIGYNFKFTDLQAAVGIGQLAHLEARIRRMKRNYQLYVEGLKGIEEILLFYFDINAGELPQWTDAIVRDRNNLDKYMRVRGIDCRRYWFPVHTQKPYRLKDNNFPNSTRLSPKALWLPSAFTLSDADVSILCHWIKKFYAKR